MGDNCFHRYVKGVDDNVVAIRHFLFSLCRIGGLPPRGHGIRGLRLADSRRRSNNTGTHQSDTMCTLGRARYCTEHLGFSPSVGGKHGWPFYSLPVFWRGTFCVSAGGLVVVVFFEVYTFLWGGGLLQRLFTRETFGLGFGVAFLKTIGEGQGFCSYIVCSDNIHYKLLAMVLWTCLGVGDTFVFFFYIGDGGATIHFGGVTMVVSYTTQGVGLFTICVGGGRVLLYTVVKRDSFGVRLSICKGGFVIV